MDRDRPATMARGAMGIFLSEASLDVRRSVLLGVDVRSEDRASSVSTMSSRISGFQFLFPLFREVVGCGFVKALRETAGFGGSCRSSSSRLTCRCFAADAAASSAARACAPSIGVSAREVKRGKRGKRFGESGLKVVSLVGNLKEIKDLKDRYCRVRRD